MGLFENPSAETIIYKDLREKMQRQDGLEKSEVRGYTERERMGMKLNSSGDFQVR